MKKIMLVLFIVALCLSLASCETSESDSLPNGPIEKLPTPQNLRYENRVLYWDEVENAKEYVVEIDSREYVVQQTCLNLEGLSLDNGDYSARVRAARKSIFKSSEYSAAIEFSYRSVSGEPEKKSLTISNISCFTKPNDALVGDFSAFKDSRFSYYVFYIGRICNVALDTGDMQYYHSTMEKPTQFTAEDVTPEMLRQNAKGAVASSVRMLESVSESFLYKRTENTDFGDDIKALWENEENRGPVEIGLAAAKSRHFSGDFKLLQSYDACAEDANGEARTADFKFETEHTAGHYIYTLLGDLDVYNLIVLDRKTDEFEIYTFSEVMSSERSLVFIDEKVEYSNLPETQITFDIKSVESCLNTDPSVDISIMDGNTTFQRMIRHNCNDGNNYDKTEEESSADWRSRHDGFEMGRLVLFSCKKSALHYNVVNGDGFAIRYQVLQNTEDLPKNNTALTKVENDTATAVKGTGINERVGYGACWVEITYTDGYRSSFGKTNILMDADVGTMIDLVTAADIDETRQLFRIDVVIAYELFAGAPGFLGIWWKEYSNWRCEYTYAFE